MLLCPIGRTPLSNTKMDGLVIQADDPTDSVTGYTDVNDFYQEGSWRMNVGTLFGTLSNESCTLQFLHIKYWGDG